MSDKVTDLRRERWRRRNKPDSTCAGCNHPADQYHPVGPITVTISEPGDGSFLENPVVRIFCNWECLALWVQAIANVEKHKIVQPVQSEWRTYPTGFPRPPWAIDRLARHRAAKLGYRIHRLRKGPVNADVYMLVDKDSSVVLGAGYTASIDAILIFLKSKHD